MARDERLEELSATRKRLVKEAEARTKELADLRARWIASEGDLAYWKSYTRSMEAELRRRQARGPQGRNALGFNLH